MNKKIFLYLAIFGSISVQAQERWSLRQCIDYAIEHNISIRQTANAAEQSAVEVNTAKWARLPNLNASAGQSWNWGRTQTAIKNEDTGDYSTVYVNTSSHGTNMSVNTSIPIFTGLEIPHQYALAKLNLKAAISAGEAFPKSASRLMRTYCSLLNCTCPNATWWSSSLNST